MDAEQTKAIRSLRALAKRWPKSLMLASLDGELVVLANDEHRLLPDGSINPDAVVATIPRIPNTGGGW